MWSVCFTEILLAVFNPKSGSRKRRQLRPRLKRHANNVDVDSASGSLSGLSIPDASSPERQNLQRTPHLIPNRQTLQRSPHLIPNRQTQPKNCGIRDLRWSIKNSSMDQKKKTTTALPEYSAFQSVEEEAKWRAELKRKGIEGLQLPKISRVGWDTRPISECIGTWVPPGPEVKCDICGGNHGRSVCSYWVSVPPNTPILNEHDYVIVCQCGWDIVDGVCGKTCRPGRPGRVVSRRLTNTVCAIKHLPPQDPGAYSGQYSIPEKINYAEPQNVSS